MKLELKRTEVSYLLMACTGIRLNMAEEYTDKNTSETRKKVLSESMKMWKKLHDNIKDQLELYDMENEQE